MCNIFVYDIVRIREFEADRNKINEGISCDAKWMQKPMELLKAGPAPAAPTKMM